MLHQTEEAGQQIMLFGIVMMINFPLFGIFWRIDQFQPPEEFSYRLIATTLSACLCFNQLWPKKLKPILPVFWYGSLLYCLPFFFTYLTLAHQYSTLWLMNCMSAIFFLLLLTRGFDALLLMLIGASLGFLCFFHKPDNILQHNPGEVSVLGLVITFSAAIIIGTLFARDRDKNYANKLLRLCAMTGSFAHDLRAPLANIRLQAELQQQTLDKLDNLKDSELQAGLKADLKDNLKKITESIDVSNRLISGQLRDIKRQKFDTKKFGIYSISTLIKQTLEEYPLSAEQSRALQFEKMEDFFIWIDELGFKNMIWNLLKHGLPAIKNPTDHIRLIAHQGGIKDDYNYLYLEHHTRQSNRNQRNKKKLLSARHIDQSNEADIILTYCQLLMKAAGGQINHINKGRGAVKERGKEEKQALEQAYIVIQFPKVD